MLKGGQMGPDNLFTLLRDGTTAGTCAISREWSSSRRSSGGPAADASRR